MKNFFTLEGTILEIGETVIIERINAPVLEKKMLKIETNDGQLLFAEIRNKKLNLLGSQNISVNCKIFLEFSFEGSHKNNIRYNNIYVNNIIKK